MFYVLKNELTVAAHAEVMRNAALIDADVLKMLDALAIEGYITVHDVTKVLKIVKIGKLTTEIKHGSPVHKFVTQLIVNRLTTIKLMLDNNNYIKLVDVDRQGLLFECTSLNDFLNQLQRGT